MGLSAWVQSLGSNAAEADERVASSTVLSRAKFGLLVVWPLYRLLSLR
jgi:hypothetical protein